MDGTEQKKIEPSPILAFLNSTIGKKQIVAITGLLLSGFLAAHMLGNFLLLVGPDAFNMYAYKLTSAGILLYAAEAGLLLVFLTHLFLAMSLTYHNKMARPVGYYKKTKSGDGANFFSRSMPITGLITLIFLISHLLHFKFGTYYTTVIEGKEVRDVYKTVMEYFAVPVNSFWYIFAMLSLSAHLYHGVQSTFQSLGINSTKWNCTIRCASRSFALLVPTGFVVLTLWCYFQQKI